MNSVHQWHLLSFVYLQHQEVGEGVADEEHDEGVPAAGAVAKGDVSAAHDEGMLVAQEVEQGDANENIENVNDGDVAEGDVSAANDEVPTTNEEPCIPSPTPPTPPPQLSHALTRRVKHLEIDKIAQALEITKLKRRVKKLERRNKVKVLKLRRLQKVGTAQRIDTSDDTVMDDVSNQGRMIADIDADADHQEVGEGVADEEHDEGVPAAGAVAKGDVSAAHDEVPTTDEKPSIPSPTLLTLPP
nr:hypothetical protein [Tanacetum cinerariifolium]